MVFLNHFIPSYFLRLGKSFEVTDWLTWLPTAQDSGLLCSALLRTMPTVSLSCLVSPDVCLWPTNRYLTSMFVPSCPRSPHIVTSVILPHRPGHLTLNSASPY